MLLGHHWCDEATKWREDLLSAGCHHGATSVWGYFNIVWLTEERSWPLADSHSHLTGSHPLISLFPDNTIIRLRMQNELLWSRELATAQAIHSYISRLTPFHHFWFVASLLCSFSCRPQTDSVHVANKISSKNRSKRPVPRPTEWINSSDIADVRMVRLDSLLHNPNSLSHPRVILEATQRFCTFALNHHNSLSGSCCYDVEISPHVAGKEGEQTILVSHCSC
jgi:hypothetical protein